MNQVRLSAAGWDTADKAHYDLAEALHFPDYYGCNLDALHDCLTELDDTLLIIENCGVPAEKMKKWPGFLNVFSDAAAENPRLKIRLLPGNGGLSGGESRKFLDELLNKYQVRRSKKQKHAFAEYAEAASRGMGYSFRRESLKSRMGGVSVNLIAGDPETAKIIFTAHYDTCAEMPFPNLVYPQNRLLTFLLQMPLVLIMIALAFGAGYAASIPWGRPGAFIVAYAVYFGLFFLFYFGPGNPHTANDNTSGVAALLYIMSALPEERKRNAAFIFFDQEEYGRVGSKAWAKAHPGITDGKALLNLDCVGDGDDFLIVAPREADSRLEELLHAAFQDGDGKRAVHCSAKNTSYNSDQKSFPNGVAAAACRKGRWGYHIPRIHTRRDVICEPANLDYVTACAVKLTDMASNE